MISAGFVFVGFAIGAFAGFVIGTARERKGKNKKKKDESRY
jgi:ABC-type nitrate/sulfonate/bicarbonate transport system permease component